MIGIILLRHGKFLYAKESHAPIELGFPFQNCLCQHPILPRRGLVIPDLRGTAQQAHKHHSPAHHRHGPPTANQGTEKQINKNRRPHEGGHRRPQGKIGSCDHEKGSDRRKEQKQSPQKGPHPSFHGNDGTAPPRPMKYPVPDGESRGGNSVQPAADAARSAGHKSPPKSHKGGPDTGRQKGHPDLPRQVGQKDVEIIGRVGIEQFHAVGKRAVRRKMGCKSEIDPRAQKGQPRKCCTLLFPIAEENQPRQRER